MVRGELRSECSVIIDNETPESNLCFLSSDVNLFAIRLIEIEYLIIQYLDPIADHLKLMQVNNYYYEMVKNSEISCICICSPN